MMVCRPSVVDLNKGIKDTVGGNDETVTKYMQRIKQKLKAPLLDADS